MVEDLRERGQKCRGFASVVDVQAPQSCSKKILETWEEDRVAVGEVLQDDKCLKEVTTRQMVEACSKDDEGLKEKKSR